MKNKKMWYNLQTPKNVSIIRSEFVILLRMVKIQDRNKLIKIMCVLMKLGDKFLDLILMNYPINQNSLRKLKQVGLDL